MILRDGSPRIGRIDCETQHRGVAESRRQRPPLADRRAAARRARYEFPTLEGVRRIEMMIRLLSVVCVLGLGLTGCVDRLEARLPEHREELLVRSDRGERELPHLELARRVADLRANAALPASSRSEKRVSTPSISRRCAAGCWSVVGGRVCGGTC